MNILEFATRSRATAEANIQKYTDKDVICYWRGYAAACDNILRDIKKDVIDNTEVLTTNGGLKMDREALASSIFAQHVGSTNHYLAFKELQVAADEAIRSADAFLIVYEARKTQLKDYHRNLDEHSQALNQL